VNAISFAIESGNVYLPVNKKFRGQFIEECSQFPNGKHDDVVDAMSQSLARLIWRKDKRAYHKKNKKWGYKQEKKYTMTKGDKIHVI
jgi:phage terminase large subunit-like protein